MATPVRVEPADDALTDDSCKHNDDGWTFSGKVKNDTKTGTNYTVTVRIVPSDNKKATVGLTTIKKTVPAGKTVEFIAKNFSKLPAKGNGCVPVVTKDA